jgi:hypothetical protein
LLDVAGHFCQGFGMDTDEREIFQFLKTWGANFTSAREIARRASSKRRFYDDPDWAVPILLRMKENGILESNVLGRYRIKPVPRKKHGGQEVAPADAEGLNEGGAAVEGEGEGGIAADEYYDQL